MTNPVVIDLSHHNPDPIDWPVLKANGTVGVIHKATEGIGYVDDKLFERAAAAMSAGLSWATYHFMRPSDSITDQIGHYLSTIDPRQGERVCLDHEDAGVSLDDLEECVRYIRVLRPDLQITIYSGHLIEEQLAGQRSDYLAENTSLWTAQYAGRPSELEWNNATWPVPALWQYTDAAEVVGIDGPVDGNKWVGSEENLVEWFGPADPGPATVVDDARPSGWCHVSIQVSPGVGVTVAINGEVVVTR